MLFAYAFFRHALLGALLVSLCCGIVGTYVVTRRRVFIAGGITHASLGGLGLGILLGISPTLTATVFAVLASIAVQWLSARRNIREDSAIAVLWSLGMALGIIFIYLTPGYTPSLPEYLFGNILAITTTDLWVMAAFTTLLLLLTIVCQRPILYVAFDAEFARLQGFRSDIVDYAITMLSAVAIVLSIRLVGIVLLLSVLTLPQMAASLYVHEYRRMTILSIVFCMTGCVAGLMLSFWAGVPSGACIVTLMVVAYFAMRLLHSVRTRHTVGRVSIVVVTCLLLAGCKSNNAVNRSIRGFTTRFNTHFNGQMAYEDGLRAMERTNDDDYTRRIDLHPVYKYRDKAPSTGGKLGRAVDKCKKCIQTKSMPDKPKRRRDNPSPEYRLWLTRGEFNPYLHNAWLLSGKAQFYEGDFDAAEATFAYTARHFWWLTVVQATCHIWRARCNLMQGDRFGAEAELEQVVPAAHYDSPTTLALQPEYKALSRQLQREFMLVLAEIHLDQDGHENEALAYLPVARRAFLTREQRVRTTFLMAQLQEETDNRDMAYRTYGDAARRAHDYKTQFNARIAQTKVMPTSSLDAVARRLNAMRRQARNAEYLDQIYYALGNVAMLKLDTTTAIAHYEQAVDRSTRGGLDKAVAALRLGEVTFAQADYVKAQKAYATAMSIISDDYPNYKQIRRLSAVLDELQTHAETIQLQDSLLRLADMPEEMLLHTIDRIIDDLIAEERRAEEEGRQAEYEAQRSLNADPLAQSTTLPTVGEQDRSWYFYNPSVVQAGKADFQRRWGARRPEDDWRRRNKQVNMLASLSGDNNDEGNGVNTDQSASNTASPAGQDAANATNDGRMAANGDSLPPIDPSMEAADAPDSQITVGQQADDTIPTDPHTREYYLAQIPRTDEQRATAHQLIEDGLYNEGVIFNEKLENFPLSISTFLDMARRYPTSAHRLDAYYAIYLMYQRMGQPDMAAAYRDSLMTAFPESAYAIAVADTNYIETLRQMTSNQDSLYIQTYTAYLHNASDSVHSAYNYVHEQWPLSTLMPKFLFLHALAYVQQGNSVAFGEALEQLTATYPQSDVSPLATMMVQGLHEGRDVQSGDTPRGMMWGATLRQGVDGSEVDSSIVFVDDPTQPFLLLLAYPTDSVSQNDLLFEIAKFNFENFIVKDFDLEIINTGGGISVLVVSGFNNADELFDYHDKMDASASLDLPEGITLIDISDPNFRALLAGRTFEEYFQWVEETYRQDE